MPAVATAVTMLQPTAETMIQATMIDPESLCSSTVAYTFLAEDRLPLWPVWQRYFEGCPAGSYTVLVHTQTPNATARQVSAVGGEELTAEHTVQGDLRFSWKMVDAMLHLYDGVEKQGKAANGCVPRWVHMSSAADAPVEPCLKVHNRLRLSTGRSFVQHYFNDGAWKSSPWHTLWASHAFALAKDRNALRSEWAGREQDGQPWVRMDSTHGYGPSAVGAHANGVHGGALDEFMWVSAMAKRGMGMHRRGLTHVDMGEFESLFIEPNPNVTDSNVSAAEHRYNHDMQPSVLDASKLQGLIARVMNRELPRKFDSADRARRAIAAARDADRFFARKFANTSDVIHALVSASGGAKGLTLDPPPPPPSAASPLKAQPQVPKSRYLFGEMFGDLMHFSSDAMRMS